ncbi:MAG: hypothetical protein IJL69_00490 [Oscillospiraceae bacterium]|jgi:hypothetical protein|nr:hypothetical protein [Oscillospiraceae bacterium]
MKKTVSALLVIMALLAMVLPVSAAAEPEGIEVFVTVANGELVLVRQSVNVTDLDKDGALTVNDALIAAHDKAFEGGSAAGYGYATGDWGLYISKLWGVENGGSYGYYVNNAMAMGLSDPVKAGDAVTAFVYTDAANYSDVYCWFAPESVELESKGDVTLTLNKMGYDENWAPVTQPLEGAVITVDGKPTELKTGADGKVTVPVTASCVIGATVEGMTIVPPFCAVAVAGGNTLKTVLWIVGCAVAVCAVAAVVVAVTRKK